MQDVPPEALRITMGTASTTSLLLWEKAVLGGVKLFPDPLEFLKEQLHVLRILHDQDIFPIVLDCLRGPVEGASDEHFLVHNGKLVVHVAQVLVMPYLDTCGGKAVSTLLSCTALPRYFPRVAILGYPRQCGDPRERASVSPRGLIAGQGQ